MSGAIDFIQDVISIADPLLEPIMNVFGFNLEDGEKEGPETPTFKASLKDRFITTKQPIAPRRIVYGQARIGGVYTFLETDGDSNEFFHIVITLSGRKLNAITGMFFDGEELPLSGNDVTGRYAGKVHAYFNLGGVDQEAIPELVAAVPDKWTTAHRQRGCAHVYVRLEFDKDLFPSGLPNIKFDVQGFDAVFDPRTSTTGYTSNAALCVADYISDSVFGFGAAYSTEILDADLVEAANICDEAIALEAGGTEARYELHGVISTATTPQDNLKALLSAMAGRAVSRGVVWLIRAGAYRAPEISLTEDDMVGSVGFKTLRPKDKLFNSGQGVFVSPGNDWIPGDYPTVTVKAYVTADNGEEIWRDFEYKFTISPTAAQRMTRQAIEINRRQITGTISCKSRAYQIVARDTFKLTFGRYGWDEKTFMAESVHLVQRGGATVVDISFSEIDAAAYSWDSSSEGDPIPAKTTNLPSPFDVSAPTVLNLDSGEEHLFVAGDGSVVSRILATWTAPVDAFVSQLEVQHKLSTASEWDSLLIDGENIQIFLSPVDDGVDYDVRLRSINAVGVRSVFITVVDHTVIGKTTLPPDVATFLIAGKVLSWVPGGEPADLAGYVVRYHQGMNRSFGDAIPLHVGILSASPYTMEVVPSDQVTVMIKAIDTSGNLSKSPAVINTDLGDPITANVLETFPQKPTWSGELTGGSVDGSSNLVADSSGSLMWDVNPDRDMWAVVSSGLMYKVVTFSQMVYVAKFTPTLALVGSLMTILFTASGDTVSLEYRTSGAGLMWGDPEVLMWDADDSVPMWESGGDYLPWPGSIIVGNSTYEVRLTTGSGVTEGTCSELTPTIDAPDIEELFADVSVGAGGTRLALTQTFDTIKVVNLTLQDDAGTAETIKILDKNASLGPLVQAFDSTQTATTATIDAFIQGY